jgi:hypothetical protein
MAAENPGKTLTYIAGGDLVASQFRFVTLTAAKTINVCAAATDRIVGVLQNNPPLDGEATVMINGKSKVVAGGPVAVGDPVSTDAAGHYGHGAPGVDTTRYAVGYAEEAAVLGQVFSITFDAVSPNRAA